MSSPQPENRPLLLLVDDERTDDNIDLLDVTREVLESEGFEVVVARNAKEAVDFIQANRQRIFAVCTDWNMPKVPRYRDSVREPKQFYGEGDEVVEEAFRNDIPVAVLSARGNDVRAYYAAQGPSYAKPKAVLDKPIEPKKLISFFKEERRKVTEALAGGVATTTEQPRPAMEAGGEPEGPADTQEAVNFLISMRDRFRVIKAQLSGAQ